MTVQRVLRDTRAQPQVEFFVGTTSTAADGLVTVDIFRADGTIFATDAATDRPVLSPQETRALQLYATGMPMKAVARRMGLGEETVKQYVGRVREKYARAGRAASTKLELYHRAVEDGHLPPHP